MMQTSEIERVFSQLGEKLNPSLDRNEREQINFQMEIIEDGMLNNVKAIGELLERYYEESKYSELPQCDCYAIGNALNTSVDVINGLRKFREHSNSLSIAMRQSKEPETSGM